MIAWTGPEEDRRDMRITREELYERIWSTPMSKLAVEWGVSIVGIVQACEEMKVPRPGSGHWTMVQRGWSLERIPLPPKDAIMPAEVTISAPQKREKIQKPQQAREAANANATPHGVKTPCNLNHAHPLVKRTNMLLARGKVDEKGFTITPWPESGTVFDVTVSKAQIERALRILDVVIKAVHQKGGRFEKLEEWHGLNILLEREQIRLRITEILERRDHQATAEELKQPTYMRRRYDWKPTGRLRFAMEVKDVYVQGIWEDGKRGTLEDDLAKIVEKVVNAPDTARQFRAQREEERRQYAEDLRRRQLEQQKQQIELENRQLLEKQADACVAAARLREFVSVCEVQLLAGRESLPLDGWEVRWLAWARAHAERLDPLKNGYLGREKQRFQPISKIQPEGPV